MIIDRLQKIAIKWDMIYPRRFVTNILPVITIMGISLPLIALDITGIQKDILDGEQAEHMQHKWILILADVAGSTFYNKLLVLSVSVFYLLCSAEIIREVFHPSKGRVSTDAAFKTYLWAVIGVGGASLFLYASVYGLFGFISLFLV